MTQNNTTNPIVPTGSDIMSNLSTGGGFEIPTNNISITPDSLKPETPVSIPPTPAVVTPDITKIDTSVDLFKPTQSENTLNDFSTKMQELNNQLVGKADYTNQLNEQYKTADINASLQDLNDQLTGLKNQQADLTNKYNYTIPNAAQVGATGKGITAGGLAPLTAAQLRTNQIEQGGLASKALTLSSMMSAYQGKLATAQNFIDQAVKAKYDPLEARLNALTKNAEIIKNSPQYSLEDKKRAQAIIDQNTAKADAIQKKKEDMAAILATATTAAQAGVKSDALTAINNAKTPMEALQLAAKYGVYTSQEDKTMAMNGYTKLRPSQLAGLKEEQILRMPNGDIYRKPSGDQETIKTIQTKYPDAGIKSNDTMEQVTAKLKKSQIYQKEVNTGKTAFGVIGTDAQGYNVYGFTDTENKTITPAAGGGGALMRTDRNNNPTAMTTDVARSLGLIEGTDYVVGDKFPGSSNLYTAKLLGDPTEMTIKALDLAANDPAKSAFYTQSGQPRWTHTAISDAAWSKMTMDQKKNVVASMYQHEGGNGNLLVKGVPKIIKVNGVDYQVAADGSLKTPDVEVAQKTPEQIDQQNNNLNFLLDTIKNAEGVAGASGRSGARRAFESTVYGATDFTSLQQYADTIKTNLMTLATDPAIKKFFGPQMSNADVQMMQSVASTLNPERQTPEQFKAELKRVKALFDKLKANVGSTAPAGGGSATTVNVIAPDGTSGTIPADQLQDALSQGFKQAN